MTDSNWFERKHPKTNSQKKYKKKKSLTLPDCVFSFKGRLVVPPSELQPLHHHFQILPKAVPHQSGKFHRKTVTAGKGRRAFAAGRCMCVCVWWNTKTTSTDPISTAPNHNPLKAFIKIKKYVYKWHPRRERHRSKKNYQCWWGHAVAAWPYLATSRYVWVGERKRKTERNCEKKTKQ